MENNFDIAELLQRLSGTKGCNGKELADMLKIFQNGNLNQSDFDEEIAENNGRSNKKLQGLGEHDGEDKKQSDYINKNEKDDGIMRQQNNQDDFIPSEESNVNDYENGDRSKENQNVSANLKDQKEPTEEEKEAWVDQVLNSEANETHPWENEIIDEGELAKKSEKEIKDQNEREEKQAENERFYQKMTGDKHRKAKMIFLSDDEEEKQEGSHPEMLPIKGCNGEEHISKTQDLKEQKNTEEVNVRSQSQEESVKNQQYEQQFLSEMKLMCQQEGDYYDVKQYELNHTEFKQISFLNDVLPLVGQLTKQINESQQKQLLSNPQRVEDTEMEQLFKDQQQEEDELEGLFRQLTIK